MSNEATENTIKVTLVRSWIGRPPIQEVTARSLRLRKIGQTAEHPDTPSVRGMISKIQHLVRVEEEGV